MRPIWPRPRAARRRSWRRCWRSSPSRSPPASAGSCCASSPAAGRSPPRPEAEEAARRLLAKPRTPPLTAAQAETLAIVSYLQPVSRPEITRIRGVAADSASGTLLERGLIEESGRSQFGAVLYRTTPLFLKLFGLNSIKDLPDTAQWDPTPDEESDLRERLMRPARRATRRSARRHSPGCRSPSRTS